MHRQYRRSASLNAPAHPNSKVVVIVGAPAISLLPDGDLNPLVRKLLRQRRALAHAGELLGREDGEDVAEARREDRRPAHVDLRWVAARDLARRRRDVDEGEPQPARG